MNSIEIRQIRGNIREIWPKTSCSPIYSLGDENGDEIFEGTNLAEHNLSHRGKKVE